MIDYGLCAKYAQASLSWQIIEEMRRSPDRSAALQIGISKRDQTIAALFREKLIPDGIRRLRQAHYLAAGVDMPLLEPAPIHLKGVAKHFTSAMVLLR